MNPDDELSVKIAAWKVQPTVPPRFQAEVWNRIAANDAARSASLRHRVFEWLSVELIRPRFATAVIVFATMIGVGAGQFAGHERNARNWKALEVRYVRSIDPNAHQLGDRS